MNSKVNLPFSLLVLATVLQIIWIGTTAGNVESLISYPSIITLLFGSLLLTRGKFNGVNTSLRILLGIIFLLSVCDRFGLMGNNGSAGISWGDFDHFVSYTQQVNSFLPGNLAFPLAVLATAAETIIGLALVLGLFIKATEIGAAMLLLLFGLAMTFSLGFSSQFYYAVFVLASSSLLLSTLNNAAFSLEKLFKKAE